MSFNIGRWLALRGMTVAQLDAAMSEVNHLYRYFCGKRSKPVSALVSREKTVLAALTAKMIDTGRPFESIMAFLVQKYGSEAYLSFLSSDKALEGICEEMDSLIVFLEREIAVQKRSFASLAINEPTVADAINSAAKSSCDPLFLFCMAVYADDVESAKRFKDDALQRLASPVTRQVYLKEFPKVKTWI